MSDPAAAPSVVTTIVKSAPPTGGRAHIELYLHAAVAFTAIVSMTVLGSLKVVDGTTIAGLIAAITGVNGAVTGLHTVRVSA